MTQDPTPRLLADPYASARLRRDLEHAQVHAVDFDLDAGLRQLGATLDGLEGAALASSGSVARGAGHVRSLASKWWAWSLTGAATVGFVWWTQSHSSEPPAVRPGALGHSGAEEEPAAPAKALLLPTGSTNRAEGSERAKEDAPESVREGSPRARAAAPSRSPSSSEARGGDDSATRRERAGGAASTASLDVSRTRARSRAETADTQESKAARGVARGAVTDESTGTIVQRTPDPGSASPTSKGGEGAATSTGVAVADSAPITAAASTSARDGMQRGAASEVEHLAHLRHLLEHEPARALKAARMGQSTFVGGLFHEERAALIVFALARLNREEEALREAHGYLRAYPRGPFAVPVGEIAARFAKRKR